MLILTHCYWWTTLSPSSMTNHFILINFKLLLSLFYLGSILFSVLSNLLYLLHTSLSLLYSISQPYIDVQQFVDFCSNQTRHCWFHRFKHRGISNQWNPLVKWLVGTKPCNLLGLHGTQMRITTPHKSLHKAGFFQCSPPCCLLHILWIEDMEMSMCPNCIHVSIWGVPPHHSGFSHSVGHAVSNKEL